jgi:hypothetical protein
MTDEKLGPLSADIARLLEAERDQLPDSRERADRIFRRVKNSLAAPPLGHRDGGAAALAHAARSKGFALSAAFAAGALSGAAGYAELVASSRHLHREHDQGAEPARATAPPAMSPPAQPPLLGSSTVAPAPPEAGPPAVPLTAPASAGVGLVLRDMDLARERALLDMARSALARGNSESAIVALHDHERTFPKGRLSEEREVMLIQLLAANGDRAAAARRAAEFRAQSPNSMLLPAVDAVMARTDSDAQP